MVEARIVRQIIRLVETAIEVAADLAIVARPAVVGMPGGVRGLKDDVALACHRVADRPPEG